MIEVQNVSKSYGSITALDRVSFAVADGAVTGFVGPNGAGKSTLIKIALGLARADVGQVLFDGVSFAHLAQPARIVGAYASPEWLPARLSCAAYLDFVARGSGADAERRAEVLRMVGLEQFAQLRIGQLSLGMKQRLGLGSALLAGPQHLILDEPVNGLDPHGVRWLRDVLIAEARSGKAVLLSSHLMAELELVADEIVFLVDGRVVSPEGTRLMREQNSEEPRVRTRSPKTEVLRAALQERGASVEEAAEFLLVTGMSAREIGELAYRSGAGLDHLEEIRPSLEDVFTAVTSADIGTAPQNHGGIAPGAEA